MRPISTFSDNYSIFNEFFKFRCRDVIAPNLIWKIEAVTLLEPYLIKLGL